MMKMSKQSVEHSAKSSNTIFLVNCWERGNEMLLKVCFWETSLPQPILSGGISPIGRNILMFMAGNVAVVSGTWLCTLVYRRVNRKYKNVLNITYASFDKDNEQKTQAQELYHTDYSKMITASARGPQSL
jgi:hypothetical protein